MSRSGRFWIGVAVALGILLRLITALALARTPVVRAPILDAAAYDHWAREIAGGHLLPREPFHLAPLYPYLCGLLYALVPDGPLAVILLQHLAGALLAGAAGFLAMGLGGPVAGATAAFLVATHGPLVLHENLLLPEVLGAVLFTAGVAQLVRGAGRPALTARTAAGAGLLLGLDALVRPTGLIVVLALAIWILFRAPGGARRRAAVAIVAGTALAVAPVTLVNRLAGGEWVLVTASGGFNFYVGNHAGADGGYVQPAGVAFSPGDAGDPTGRGLAERATGRRLGARGVSDYWTGRALAFVRSEPRRAGMLFLRKVALVWSRAEVPQIVDVATVRAQVPLFGRLPLTGPWLIMPLALLGLVIGFRGRRERAVLRITFGAFTLATALFFVTERYRVQAVPLLAVVAGAAAAELVAIARSRSPRRLLLAGGALALAVIAVDPRWLGLGNRLGNPWVPPMNRALGLIRAGADSGEIAQAFAEAAARGPEVGRVFANRGEWLRQRGDLAAAQADLERAVALAPEDPLAWTALGGVQAAAGDTAARGSYARALALDPGHTPAALGLGQVLVTMREPELALVPLRRALVAPDSAAAHDALGVALLMTGDADRAFYHLQRAIAIDPQRATFRLHLGLALADAGREAAAAAAIDSALAVDPRHRTARLSAALLARERGDLASARAHLDTLLAVNPGDAEARALRAALGGGSRSPVQR